MRGFKFNFITILAFVLLVVYAYLAAMGALYNGRTILLAGLFFIGTIALVSVCIYLMCRARATRWQEKIGIPAQIGLGIIIVATFFAIGAPFSSYVKMLGNKGSISQDISDVVSMAKQLDVAYNQYAENRVNTYNPQESTPARQSIRIEALKRQLLPPELGDKQKIRSQWLNDISQMGLSNIQMPNNLANMDSCVAQWITSYAKMSEVVFADEVGVAPFEYTEFGSRYTRYKESLNYGIQDKIWAIIVAFICSVFMLIPYFTTDKDFSGATDGSRVGFSDKMKAIFVRTNNSTGSITNDEPEYL